MKKPERVELAWLAGKGHTHLVRRHQRIIDTCGRLHPFTNPPERERCADRMRKKWSQ